MLKGKKAIVAAVLVVLGAAGAAAAGIAIIKPYAVGIDGDYYTKRLLSVGDTVPETSNTAKQFQMIGIPDGLGAYKERGGRTTTLYMNHELTHNTLSEPVVGEPLNRGPIVSKLTLNRQGKVVSGERAYDTVYLDDKLVGPAPTTANTTPSFSRFCSASLAGREQGFDRPIFLTNEESTGASTFDGKGGLAVAVFDNEAHGLTALGHFAWENALVQSGTGRYTVIMSMEDGPASQDRAQSNSQLYMYVGEKKPTGTVLERNGLVGGKLYVFRSKDLTRNSESTFLSGAIDGEWVSLGNVSALSDVQLEAASDAVNAMIFARPEDGAFNPHRKDEYFFVTTGEGTGNALGRLYSIELTGPDSTGPAKLTVEYNADQVVAAGGDIALSPDNIDTSRDYLMINEDGTATSRLEMAKKNRDGSIWRFDLDKNGVDVSSRLRVAELIPPGRDRIAVGPGVWETSGIIDTAKLFGDDTWLFDVQAHAPTTAPKPNTVEDGQLLMLVGPDDKAEDDDDSIAGDYDGGPADQDG